MASILTQAETSVTALAIDLSNLATSSTFLTGMQSDQIVNTSRNLDIMLTIAGITGHASTAPTIGQAIGVWVAGQDVSFATRNFNTLTATAGARTLSHAGVFGGMSLAANPVVLVATAALVYPWNTISLASLFRGRMPKYMVAFASHSHTGALGAANNNLFTYVGITGSQT